MRRIMMVLPLIALFACGPSKEEFEKAQADAQALSAEKDSLIAYLKTRLLGPSSSTTHRWTPSEVNPPRQ